MLSRPNSAPNRYAANQKLINVDGGPESYVTGWCQSGGGSPEHSTNPASVPHNNDFSPMVVPYAGVAFTQFSGQKGGPGGSGGVLVRF